MSSLYHRSMGVRPSQEIELTASVADALQQLEQAFVLQGFRVRESSDSGFLVDYGYRLAPAFFDILSVFPGKVGKLGKFARVRVGVSSSDAGCTIHVALELAFIIKDAAEPMLRALQTAVAGFAERGQLVSAGTVATRV